MSTTCPPCASPFIGVLSGSPAVVLDTNVVLDWLLFRDAGVAPLADLLQVGRLHWHATASMRSELASVLPRHQFLPWSPDCEHILSVFDRMAIVCEDPHSVGGPTGMLLCRDRDDQKFIDLAVAIGAQWLLSKDRALLALAKPARAHGVQVLTPAQWLRQTQTARGGG